MDGHPNTDLLTGRHDSLKEVAVVIAQLIPGHVGVLGHNLIEIGQPLGLPSG